MKPYLLLTPGPLTTSETVKEAMMTDWCQIRVPAVLAVDTLKSKLLFLT